MARGVVSARPRVRILPTKLGIIFGMMLAIVLMWAINYNTSMGFAAVFLLAAVTLDSFWRTYAQLSNLELHAGRCNPVFAGQSARFSFALVNRDRRPRYGVTLHGAGAAPRHMDLEPGGRVTIRFDVPALRRGVLRTQEVRLSTTFPLGLFRAWSSMSLDQTCLVYPRPIGDQALPNPGAGREGRDGCCRVEGGDDFMGLRAYVPGDARSRIAWKAAARGRGLLVKQFGREERRELWLSWKSLPHNGTEERLSQLSRWIVDVETAGHPYGLELPDLEIGPDRGMGHRRRCLEALALFKRTDRASSFHD